MSVHLYDLTRVLKNDNELMNMYKYSLEVYTPDYNLD